MLKTSEHFFKEFKDWLLMKSGLAWKDNKKEHWTPKIFNFFKELGEREKYRCIFTQTDIEQSEYLVDLVWKHEGPRRWLQLAMESELSDRSDSGILEDFEKLIDIKSYNKIGIFMLDTEKDNKLITRMLGLLDEQMINFKDEKYLVIFLRYDDKENKLCLSAYDLDFKGDQHKQIHKECYDFPPAQ